MHVLLNVSGSTVPDATELADAKVSEASFFVETGGRQGLGFWARLHLEFAHYLNRLNSQVYSQPGNTCPAGGSQQRSRTFTTSGHASASLTKGSWNGQSAVTLRSFQNGQNRHK